ARPGLPQRAERSSRRAGGSATAAARAGWVLALRLAALGGHAALAGARQVFPHLVEARLVALPLYRGDVGRGERQLQLLRGKGQIAARDLVFAHVEVGVPGVSGSAGGERREPDLIRGGRHVV